MKIDVPAAWADAEDNAEVEHLEGRPELVKQVRESWTRRRMAGDSLPVSVFVDHADGQFEQGAAAYEKRGVSVSVAKWDAEKCTECNSCSFVCPHACIRPFGLTDEEAAAGPEAMAVLPMKGKHKELKYTLAISRWTAWAAACASRLPGRRADHGRVEERWLSRTCSSTA